MLSLCTDIVTELHQLVYSYAYNIICHYFTDSILWDSRDSTVVVAARLCAEQSPV
jgi:hypothetical protein